MSAMARWCARHHRIVLTGWLLLAAGLITAVVLNGSAFKTSADMPNSESTKAYALIARIVPGGAASESTTTGKIAWRLSTGSITSAEVKEQVGAVLDRIAKKSGVVAVISPYTAAGAQQISNGTNTAYAQVILKSEAKTGPIEQVVKDTRLPGIEFSYGGTAFDKMPEPTHGPEAVGILIALLLLMLMFRSWWASLLPLITGVAGVLVSLMLVVLGSHVVTLDSTSITMASMMGLGVGIDYALFIVNRARKGLADGKPVPEAVGEALNTSGRAVIFAGLTVIVAMLGIRVVGLGVLTGMGEAAAVTVGCTVLAAITLLPALLGKLGLKVLSRKQRNQLAERLPDAPGNAANDGKVRGFAGLWARLVGFIPWLIAPLALGLVLVAASPVVKIRIGDSDASSDPASSWSHKYYQITAPAFGPGLDNPLIIAASTPDLPSQQAFTKLAAQLSTGKNVVYVTAPTSSADGAVRMITIIPGSSAQAKATTDLITRLRDHLIPEARSGTNLKAYVGGKAATSQDLADALLGKLPLYLGIIAILGFLLLALAFRSFLVPLVGALSNITTILVGLGAITAIFQLGWGSEQMRVGSGAPIMYIVPVIIVGIVFGLSMDYQVFLVSRIHEEWNRTRDNRRAIRVGVAETGRVIATAALIMLGVFASFSFGGQRIVSAIGIGLALSVLVDAFVVRMTLIPALMNLIGPANWWYPRWASRITPHLAVEGRSEVTSESLEAAELVRK